MNTAILVPNGYDILHWVIVVVFTDTRVQLCTWARSKVK